MIKGLEVRSFASVKHLQNHRPQQSFFHNTMSVDPVSSSESISALQTLCQRPGAPRWAAVGWAVSLIGERRDQPRVDEKVDRSSNEELTRFIDRLQVQPATVTWPEWLGGREDAVLLQLGVAAGKPDKLETVDIPQEVRGLVDIFDDRCRFRSPQWNGAAVDSSAHLQAVAALVQHAGADAEAVAAAALLVRWAVGWARADVGYWARRQALAEAHTAAAAAAFKHLSAAEPEAVLAEVLGRGQGS